LVCSDATRAARYSGSVASVDIRTHHSVDADLCGVVRSMAPGQAVVDLGATAAMAVDDHGLVHGGFIFGLADYAAMVAVNEPTVVLAGARVRFVAPASVGDQLVAEAQVGEDGTQVSVTVTRGETLIMSGEFSCRVLDHHVLEP
jgi:acyl-coenzyme A thioesterase PaaI-like protein